ncbi:MAG: hydrogenase nickel incorporation protein HypB [Candidatus Omnitrophica bacterium]|nr:hydrogenase nickel incorporation protein HypB [Candidatus Omnitrophota bacterium]
MEIKVMNKVLAANDAWAQENRSVLKAGNVLMVNLIGSPGAGKTALLEATLDLIKDKYKVSVIEGDIATTKDAERIQKKGVAVCQINTGTACHLDANLVNAAIKDLSVSTVFDIIFVENIGNLVCPAEFDIGEAAKIAVLSVTEGDDKIEKYPLLFSEAKALLITKMSMHHLTNFNMDEAEKAFRKLNPAAPIFKVDNLKSDGLAPWVAFLLAMKNGK